jgi:hypothetical protein
LSVSHPVSTDCARHSRKTRKEWHGKGREGDCGAAGSRNDSAGENSELVRGAAKRAEKLGEAERELAELKATAATAILNPLRKTVPASTSEMLAKHGIAEGPVDVRTLDAALAGLSLEQRIAVKSQLLRAGAIA